VYHKRSIKYARGFTIASAVLGVISIAIAIGVVMSFVKCWMTPWIEEMADPRPAVLKEAVAAQE